MVEYGTDPWYPGSVVFGRSNRSQIHVETPPSVLIPALHDEDNDEQYNWRNSGFIINAENAELYQNSSDGRWWLKSIEFFQASVSYFAFWLVEGGLPRILLEGEIRFYFASCRLIKKQRSAQYYISYYFRTCFQFFNHRCAKERLKDARLLMEQWRHAGATVDTSHDSSTRDQ